MATSAWWGANAPLQSQWAAASGAMLFECQDLELATSLITRHLTGEADLTGALEQAGVSRHTLDMLSTLLPSSEADVAFALALGRAWVLGRRSRARPSDVWAPVVSGVDLDPKTVPRLTGETLIALIAKARREVLIATAYVDGRAVDALLPSLMAAAGRGVRIAVAAVGTLERDNALDALEVAFATRGLSNLSITRLETGVGFPHLKVLVTDARAAYLGSANFTLGGITTNFEIGALVEGRGVEAIRAFVVSLMSDVKNGNGSTGQP